MEGIHFDKDKEFDLLLIGRVAIDFNPTDYYKALKESNNFQKYLGGSPANIAVGLARLGKKVGFIAKVSDDSFGDFVTEYFNQEGIDTSSITRCKNGEKLGLTFTEMLSETESSILMYRNDAADLQLSTEDIHEEYIEKAKAILISGTALAKSPSREAVLKALMLAKKHHIPVIFDIDYRAYTWKNTDEITIYYSLVAKESDIILGSREEFDLTERFLFTKKDESLKDTIVEGTSLKDTAVNGILADDMAKRNMKEKDIINKDSRTAAYYHSMGAKVVVIKHGKEGSTAYIHDNTHYSVKPFPIKLLKSFGGGDGYASAFLYGLLEGKTIAECLLMGSASAAMLVASHACSKDMPTLIQLTEFMQNRSIDIRELIRSNHQ